MKNNFKKVLLILILLLAALLRLWRLDQFPAGLNADEAAIGYNAYSLLKTGRDEFGQPWPINFQSFNDYKPGFYFYLVLPLVKLLGLNVWAVRLPSALLGISAVYLIYLLVKEWWRGEKEAEVVALGAALLLAVNPWHLHFSRGGWETNAATTFILLGVWLFFSAFDRPRHYLFSVVGFALAMFTYHSARLVVPLLGVGLLSASWRQVFKKENFWPLVLAATVGGGLMIILAASMLGAAGSSRFSGVGILADQGPLWRVNELRGQHQNPYGPVAKLLHNKGLEYGQQFFDNWLRHFDGNFLFISGDEIQRNRVPEMGQLYLVSLPFLVLGFYFLIKKKPFAQKTLLWWLAVAPVASALTFQSPHAIRALNLAVPLTIIAAYGLVNFAGELRAQLKSRLFAVFGALFLGLFFWNFSFYLHQYYVHYPQTYPAAWEDGFEELAAYVSERQEHFEKIYITDKYDQPYILMAFFLKYPPQKFQLQAEISARDQYGFSTVKHFDKFFFGPINLSKLSEERNVMIVGALEEIPDSATIVKRIYFKDGKKEAFRIVEN